MYYNNIKKKTSLLLACVLCITALFAAPFAFGDDAIEINETNFPDPVFRQIISDNYDTSGNGTLDSDERAAVTQMQLAKIVEKNNETISDLTGIEYFTSLTTLRLGYTGLTSLDVSALTELTTLTCQGNYLTSLDLSKNTALESVNCSDNALETLTLPSTSTLAWLHCYANSLTSIDVSVLTGLTTFRCDGNELTSLDLSANSSLTSLRCCDNHLAALDLSATAVTNATNGTIGDQTVTVEAQLKDGSPIVPFENTGLTADNYRSSTLEDYGDGNGFTDTYFTFTDVKNVDGGFTYECYPNKDGCENMTVSVTVTRNFYQVSFYTDDSLATLLSTVFTVSGNAAAEPEVTSAPQCKKFAAWSEDVTSITADKTVYATYADNHNYTSVALESDKDTVTVTCENNDSSYQVSFINDVANTHTGDEKFDEHIDVNNDGYINAKDYDILYKALISK